MSKIISFKNGNQIKVHDAVVDKLYDRMVDNKGAEPFQFFKEEKTGEVILAINIADISSIYSSENII